MRILIVRLSSLGDIVMSMPVLQYIKKALPHSKVEWLVDSSFSEILSHNVHLNDIHSVPIRRCKKNIFRCLFEVLTLKKRLGHFDLVIDMQGLIKSAVISRYLGKNVVGFDKESAKEGFASRFYTHTVSVPFSDHILKRNLELVKNSLGIDISYDEIMLKEPFLFFQKPAEDFSAFLSKTKKNILVVIGGSWSSKVYPKESLKEVLHRLEENALILWSNQDEYERAKWIATKTPHARVLPKMNLNDVKALITHVDLVLGNDTGPCHMAWALSKPSITILGCTSITRIPVNRFNLAVTSNTCVNPSKINKNDLSIQDIPPYEVVENVENLLANL